jgi:hypothetical protein
MIRIMRLSFGIVSICGLLTGCVNRQETVIAPSGQSSALNAALLARLAANAKNQTMAKTVVAGSKTKLNTTFNINPDCTQEGDIDVRITQPPEHGHAEVVHDTGFPSYPPASPQAIACGKKRVPGVSLIYTADKDYTGDDTIKTEIIVAGIDATRTYAITVK